MRILHLGKFYSPIEGGIESISRFVVESMKENIQRIISFNKCGITIEDEIDSVPVIRASSQGIVASQPLSLKYFFELRRNIRMFHPDVIHFHYPNPLGALYLLFAIKKENRLIVHWHSDVVAQRFLHRFISPIERRLLKRADAIIATSPNYVEASKNLISTKSKVSIIPCSIDEDRFKITQEDETKIKAIKNKFGDIPIVFFIGRHVEYKGIKYLLEAEKYVKSKCTFVIAGQGPLTDELKQQYTSPRIHWIGRLSEEQMNLYYHAASIFAFPSITRNEAFGVVLAESMYCGCPAVTFTIPGSGVNWVSLNGITGIESPNKDVRAYASAIDELLTNNSEREAMSVRAKDRVKRLFVKTCVKELYVNLYDRLCL